MTEEKSYQGIKSKFLQIIDHELDKKDNLIEELNLKLCSKKYAIDVLIKELFKQINFICIRDRKGYNLYCADCPLHTLSRKNGVDLDIYCDRLKSWPK